MTSAMPCSAKLAPPQKKASSRPSRRHQCLMAPPRTRSGLAKNRRNFASCCLHSNEVSTESGPGSPRGHPAWGGDSDGLRGSSPTVREGVEAKEPSTDYADYTDYTDSKALMRAVDP